MIFDRIAVCSLFCSLVLLFSLGFATSSGRAALPVADNVPLTTAERAWLQSHRELVLAPSPDFAPIEFFDRNGRYVGATADYVRILERKLGVVFRIRRIDDRREIDERTKRGEVDIWGAASQSADRARYMRFSRPYLTFPALIIVRKNSYRNLTLDKLGGLRVVSPALRATDAYLRERYPQLNKVLVPDVQTGLNMVSFGEADAMVVNAAPASYFIGELGLTNLAVAGQSDVVWPLCFASRRDWPLLASILQKGLDSITPEERDKINSTWVSLKLEGYVSHRSFILAIVAGGGVVALVSILFLLLNRSLRSMVRQRTAELQVELDERKRVEQELRRYQDELEAKTEPLEAIRSIADKLYCSLDLQTVAEQAVHAMMFRSGSPSVAVFLADYATERLDMLASEGFGAPLLEASRSLPLHASLSGLAVETGRVVFSPDMTVDARLEPTVRNALLTHGYRGTVCVPLLAEERVLGVLNLLYREPCTPSPGGEQELLVIGQTVGLAISHAVNLAHLRQEMIVRRRAEDELRQLNAELEQRVVERTAELAEAKERAEAADHLKSAFLATMSHELRTPLNSIIGFTGVILQGMAGPLNDEQRKQMEMVKASASHLLALINDVLDLSKIEAGQLTLSDHDFDLAASLEKVVKTVQPLVDSKGLSLVVDCAADVAMVRSDQRRVEQILLNLLSNAIKFTETGRIALTCGISGGVVRMSVSDTGIGIKQEDLANLFKPFRQLESGLTRRFEGTGLGLSICKRLIEQMGGEIRVESRLGEGSTFFVTLPVAGRMS